MQTKSKHYAKIQFWLGIPSLVLSIVMIIIWIVKVKAFMLDVFNNPNNINPDTVLNWTSGIIIWFIILGLFAGVMGVARLVLAIFQITNGSQEHNTLGIVAGILNIIMPLVGWILSIIVWTHKE